MIHEDQEDEALFGAAPAAPVVEPEPAPVAEVKPAGIKRQKKVEEEKKVDPEMITVILTEKCVGKLLDPYTKTSFRRRIPVDVKPSKFIMAQVNAGLLKIIG
jgi:hypothetical protein